MTTPKTDDAGSLYGDLSTATGNDTRDLAATSESSGLIRIEFKNAESTGLATTPSNDAAPSSAASANDASHHAILPDDLLGFSRGGFGSVAAASLIAVRPPKLAATLNVSALGKSILLAAGITTGVAVAGMWLANRIEHRKTESSTLARAGSTLPEVSPHEEHARRDVGPAAPTVPSIPSIPSIPAAVPQIVEAPAPPMPVRTPETRDTEPLERNRPRPHPRDSTTKDSGASPALTRTDAESQPADGDSANVPSETAPPREAVSPQASDVKVDCLLEPQRPECVASRAKPEAPPEATKPPPDPNLPDQLSMAQVRTGMESVKPLAKVCGQQHGAPAGTEVRVKLSIAGDTGQVVSATALDLHAGTPLGSCVADALKQAKFPSFKKQVMGLAYPMRMD